MSHLTQLHHIESGSGPPLLFLHGLFDSLETWEDLLPLLSGRFKVYAVDLPGFGLTPLPKDWPESLCGMVKSVVNFLDVLGIEEVALIGNSMGGSLALALTQMHPKRIRKLALLNPYGLPEVPQAVANARRPFLGNLLPYMLYTRAMKLCVKGLFSRSLYDHRLLTPARITRVSKPFSSLRQRQNLFRFLRAISPDKIREVDARLPEIHQSVLILWGKQDGWLTEAHWQHLSKRLSSVEVLEIDDCGHLPQIEKPKTVAAALIPFLLQKKQEE